MVADLEVAKPYIEKCYKLAWYLVKLDLTSAEENNDTRASVQGKRGRIRSRPEEAQFFQVVYSGVICLKQAHQKVRKQQQESDCTRTAAYIGGSALAIPRLSKAPH